MRLVEDDVRCGVAMGRPDELARRIGTLGLLLELAEEVVGFVGGQLTIRHDSVEVLLDESGGTGTGPTRLGFRLIAGDQRVHLVGTVVFPELKV